MRHGSPSWLLISVLGAFLLGCAEDPDVEETTAIQRVEIDPAEAELELDEELELEVRAYSARGGELSTSEVAFESNAPEVASVSAEGVVKALRPGAAIITATLRGKSGSMNVRVLEPVRSIAIEPDPVELRTSESVQLTAVAYDASGERLEGRTVEWSVGNDFVATVDEETGLLTAKLREDSTEVIARHGEVEGRATVIVTKKVADIEIRPEAPVVVREKGSLQLEAVLRDEGGRILEGRAATWSSSDEAIATVDAEGLLRGIAPGEVEIAASADDVTATAPVTVQPEKVHRIEIEPEAAELVVGESLQFTVRTFNEAGEELFGRPLEWRSFDPEIQDPSYAEEAAPIDEEGRLDAARPFQGKVEVWVPGDSVSTTAEIRIVLRMSGVAAGQHHTCALTAGGEAWCWGESTYGQTGIPPSDERLPAPVQTELRFASIAAGATHSCGLSEEGVAYCWGNNEHGQLGDGSTEDSIAPVEVERAAGAAPFTKIYTGDGYSCAIDADQAAFCWGLNDDGRLGNGQRSSSPLPQPVSGEVDEHGAVVPIAFEALSLGVNSPDKNTMTCGLSVAGVGYCWGENETREHGIGAGPGTLRSATPVRLAGGLSFASLSVGALHACGLTPAGEAYCWGRGVTGELGDGVSEPDHARQAPHPVDGGHRFALIGAGLEQSCALTEPGELYCWGRLDGTQAYARTPRKLGGSQAWFFETLSAGDRHFCAIDAEKVVYCWGANFNGQLGNTSGRVRIETPIRIFPED